MIDVHHSPTILPPGDYTAVLVSCSLSGDTDELLDGTYLDSSDLVPEVRYYDLLMLSNSHVDV